MLRWYSSKFVNLPQMHIKKKQFDSIGSSVSGSMQVIVLPHTKSNVGWGGGCLFFLLQKFYSGLHLPTSVYEKIGKIFTVVSQHILNTDLSIFI